ncbi:MAG: hypothetical protein Q9177_000546, partial [Variospora cf. flavescens]
DADVLSQPEELRFYGIQKFPKVGLFDGKFHRNLGETGMGYYQEIEIIKTAHEMGLVTTPDVFSVDEAERMTRAGADVHRPDHRQFDWSLDCFFPG